VFLSGILCCSAELPLTGRPENWRIGGLENRVPKRSNLVSRAHRNAADVAGFLRGGTISISTASQLEMFLIHMFVKILGDFFSLVDLIEISEIDIRARGVNRCDLT